MTWADRIALLEPTPVAPPDERSARALDAPRLGRAATEAFWWAPGLWVAAYGASLQIPIDAWAMLPQASLRLAEPFDRPPIPQVIDAAVVILPASIGAALYLSMLIRLAIALRRAQSPTP